MSDLGLPAPEREARKVEREGLPRLAREAALAALLIFLFAATAIQTAYLMLSTQRSRETIERMRPEIEYLASLIDARAHSQLNGRDNRNSAAHRELSARLMEAQRYHPDISRIFTGRLRDGNVEVVLDTTAPEVPFGIMQPSAAFPIDSPEADAVRAQRPFATEDPALRKGSGHFLAVLVPLPGADPQTRDFLYADSAVDEVASGLTRALRDTCLAVAGVASLAAGWLLFSWRRRSTYHHAIAANRARDSEELFRSTFELSPVPMCMTGPGGRILKANDAFCAFLGYSRAEVLGLVSSDYIHREDLQKEQPFRHSMQARHASRYRIEQRFHRRDGQTVWGLCSVAAVHNTDGQISHYMTQVVDITGHVQAEKTLRLSSERLDLAADAGRVGMWDCDLVSGAMVWNDVMHAVYHTPAGGFTPSLSRQEEFLHPDDRDAVKAEFRRCVESGEPYQQEYRILLSDGSVRHLKANAVVFRGEDARPLRAVGTSIDITTQKVEAEELIRAKEAALSADRAKSEFLAVMSHEIRTPLNGVLGFVSMLKDTPLNPVQLGFIETMESSGQGLLTLVNDILDLSKIEAREMHIQTSTFGLRSFLQRVHYPLSGQASAKGLRFDLNVDAAVPELLHSDPTRLGQILTNMLANAVKFTDHGGVDLLVSAKPVDRDEDIWEWSFAVRDSGPGIPADALPHLFEHFYQVDSSATRRHGGSGLGLAISQRLAHLLNGSITVQSSEQAGSEFTLTLIAPAGQASVPTDVATRMAHGSSRIRGKRILVVEDNAVNRRLCALQLKRLGCETEFAESGREAVEKVAAGNFDAVLMDMQLPELDGCAATREIRRQENGGERLSIIALTANAMPEDRARCLEAGMDDFLSKPLQYETLAATLSQWA